LLTSSGRSHCMSLIHSSEAAGNSICMAGVIGPGSRASCAGGRGGMRTLPAPLVLRPRGLPRPLSRAFLPRVGLPRALLRPLPGAFPRVGLRLVGAARVLPRVEPLPPRPLVGPRPRGEALALPRPATFPLPAPIRFTARLLLLLTPLVKKVDDGAVCGAGEADDCVGGCVSGCTNGGASDCSSVRCGGDINDGASGSGVAGGGRGDSAGASAGGLASVGSGDGADVGASGGAGGAGADGTNDSIGDGTPAVSLRVVLGISGSCDDVVGSFWKRSKEAG
jgi:hypothetical protein